MNIESAKEGIKFVIGLAWTGVIVWFTAKSYRHLRGLDFVILFTSGAFGWVPLARSVYPDNPVLWSLASFFSVSVAIAVCALGVTAVMENGMMMSLFAIIISVGTGWLLIGGGWLVWKMVRRLKR